MFFTSISEDQCNLASLPSTSQWAYPSGNMNYYVPWSSFKFFNEKLRASKIDLSCPTGYNCGGDDISRQYMALDGTTVMPTNVAGDSTSGIKRMFDQSNVLASENCAGQGKSCYWKVKRARDPTVLDIEFPVERRMDYFIMRPQTESQYSSSYKVELAVSNNEAKAPEPPSSAGFGLKNGCKGQYSAKTPSEHNVGEVFAYTGADGVQRQEGIWTWHNTKLGCEGFEKSCDGVNCCNDGYGSSMLNNTFVGNHDVFIRVVNLRKQSAGYICGAAPFSAFDYHTNVDSSCSISGTSLTDSGFSGDGLEGLFAYPYSSLGDDNNYGS